MTLTVTATEEYGARNAEVLLTNVMFVNATGVVEQLTTDKQIAAIRYINMAGQESEKPFDGLNIVVTTYTDGTTSTVKVLR